ncbi:MAG: hypothetical protein AABX73_00400 [Nanoarchaeota archaeon]
MNVQEALNELRKEEKRKFDQTLDLIINLRGMDVKKENINLIIVLPNKIKEKKVCGFLKSKSPLIPTITEPEFSKYKDKKALKNLVKNYDYFISLAQLMPSVATTFGKILGPVGKMPSPQLGVISEEKESAIREALEKIAVSTKIRIKEPSIKLMIGKESMKDQEIIENVEFFYKSLLNALPKKIENVKSVMIKFTMTKPIKLEIK